jgi:amino acid adenylation domain-containing protein
MDNGADQLTNESDLSAQKRIRRRQWLRGEALDFHLSYWKQQLGNSPSALELPTDHPRSSVHAFQSKTHSLMLPDSLTESLKALSGEADVALFVTLLAAFQTMLHRYTGQDDIVVGSPITGEMQDRVNILALRTDLSGNPSFRALLGRVREVVLGAYAHQALSFEQLAEELQPAWNLSHNPLFHAIFAFQSRGAAIGFDAVSLLAQPWELALFIEETAQGLVATFEYNANLFEAATISRMTGHFQTLLEGVAAYPEQRLSELPLLTEAERHQLLVEWNQTRTDYPSRQCIHHLFEEQAERTPEAIAVGYDDQRLTYQELNQRANQLAHYLQKLGVGPDVLVAIGVERSVEMIIGWLGILKAGGAYLPLDAAAPKERLAFLLADAQPKAVLTQHRWGNALPAVAGPVIRLDWDWPRIAQENSHNPKSGARGENLAYLMYTSGSTGQPKGVSVPHRAALRLVCNSDYVKLSAADRVGQASNAAFDAATFEVWGALLNGARLVGLSRQTTLSPRELVSQLQEQGITTLFLTTALFNQVAQTVPEGFGSLDQLLFGGEAVDLRWVKAVLDEGPPRRLLHAYGPTESTTFTTWHEVKEVEAEAATIPIGRPIANTTVYVLDEGLNPVPVGVEGEVYIGGAGLARGYLNRPDLTAERFVPDPFSERPGSRLYRTGDRGRYLSEGAIAFVGRRDFQVKVRGFRVELGEIEAALREHSAVQETAVLLREDVKGEKYLAAYIVSNSAQATSRELRRFLKERLPEYMTPSAFVFLDALPLTSNGKIDRRALPAPGRERPELDETFVEPRTPVEERVAGIWAEVLGLERVGIHDNFFNLGGHSLLATQAASRVREAFQVETPLRVFFETPTVADLAKIIQLRLQIADCGLQIEKTRPPVRPIQPIPRDGILPLSFSQERVWFIEQLHPANLAYNFQSTIRFRGRLDASALEQSLNEIVRRHEIFRTTFPAINGRPVQVVHPSWPVNLTPVDLQDAPAERREAEAQRRIHQEFQKSFDLTQLPLIRWTLLRLSPQEHILVHVEHHLVHDGWSFNVFLREMLELYKAFSAGEPSPLPEPPIQFADFAYWQRRWMQGEAADAQLAYWKEKLAGDLPALQLPYDRPRPPTQTFQGSAFRTELPLNLCESLRALSRQEGVTLFMTMQAAFVALLHRYSGQDDICLGAGLANRRWRETEDLIGMLINNVVLRTDLSGNPAFRELLRRVRETTLEAYARQDIPFDRVVEALQPERDMSRNPLFQAMFSFHDAPLPDLKLPGLTISLLEGLNNGTAKFDLNVIAIPRSEQRVGGSPQEEGISFIWEYNTDLFNPDSIARMEAHYRTLLEGVVADPEQRLSDLPLLTEKERRQLLVEWNNTQVDYPRESCIHEAFEEQAERTPEAIAVVYGDQQLTYQELNQRANQLAHYLQRLGVGPDTPVAVAVERSVEMVVGWLGILKAGGAYLPLDAAAPKERLAFLLADARPKAVLTQHRQAHSLPAFAGPLVCLDSQRPRIAEESPHNPQSPARGENLAYLMYTSGSTGQPKGVSVPHRAALRLVCNTDYVKLSQTDRIAQASNAAFDAATFEVWGALLNGAQVVGLSRQTTLSPHELVAHLRQQGVTTLFLTTALFNQVAQTVPEGFGSLDQLLFGGEAVDPRWVKAVLQAQPPKRLLHVYGPTESTTFTTWHLVKEVEAATTTIPIGRPIANTTVYLLDEGLNPVPVGMEGELYIGGDGLARGYLNRPELTAERFIPDPFSKTPGARLYKTGDLVRYLADGRIEFLGRIDHQVKVRGFRVELGEIEAALGEHPAVRQTVVMAREDVPGEKRLAAYIVLHPGAIPTVNELRRFLMERLPEYMVPSAFMFLDALPLTPNGKVDRRALPAPEGLRPELEAAYAAPQTEVEQTIAEIWQEVLRLEKVGLHDNFFDLGGHSLLMAYVLGRLREVFQKEISMIDLFKYPTISALTNYLNQAAGEQPSSRRGDDWAEKLDEGKQRLAQLHQRRRSRKV